MKTAELPHRENLETLAALGHKELRDLHERGSCPTLEHFKGVAAGKILHPRYANAPRLWRGKVFDHVDGVLGGLNRIGMGPFEFRRYRFVARIATSAFGPRQVVWLDHDRAGNPAWVRRFHDEVVQIAPGLYLASSHILSGGRLRYAGYFALDLRPSA
jgi:hypothetical protein